MLNLVQVEGLANKVLRSRAGLWFRGHDLVVPRRRNVLALLCLGGLRGTGPRERRLIPAANIVTDAGDIYYAQRGAGETPTNAFGIMELTTGREVAAAPAKTDDRGNYDTLAIAGTQKAFDATYPKSNDADADNTGAGADVTTYLASYTKADFSNGAVSHGIITNVTPGAAEPILSGFQFAAPFAKTADDTLKVFVNHQKNGV